MCLGGDVVELAIVDHDYTAVLIEERLTPDRAVRGLHGAWSGLP